MFHVKRFFLFIIVSMLSTETSAQGSVVLADEPIDLAVQKDSTLLGTLEVNPVYLSATPAEKEVIYWVNFVRTQPNSFLRHVLKPFLQHFPDLKNSYSRSLIQELNTLSPLKPVTPSVILTRVASHHSADLAGHPSRGISHRSSDGKSFESRMQQFGLTSCVAENIFEGKQDGLFSVLLLLIDNGVESLGHRKNILDPKMTNIGVAFTRIAHSKDRFILVQNFSCP